MKGLIFLHLFWNQRAKESETFFSGSLWLRLRFFLCLGLALSFSLPASSQALSATKNSPNSISKKKRISRKKSSLNPKSLKSGQVRRVWQKSSPSRLSGKSDAKENHRFGPTARTHLAEIHRMEKEKTETSPETIATPNAPQQKKTLGAGKSTKAKIKDEEIFDVNLKRALKRREDNLRPWAIRSFYRLSTDLLDKSSPRIFKHILGGSFEYTLKNEWTAYIQLSGQGISTGSEWQNTPADRWQLLDTTLGVSIPFSIQTQPFFLGAFTDIPHSEESRYEGYKNVSGLSLNTFFPFWQKLVFIPVVSHVRVFSDFSYSPTTKSATVGSISTLSLQLSGSLGAGFGTGVRGASTFYEFSDHVGNTQFSSALFLSHTSFAGKLNVNLSFMNGSYPDQTLTDLWFLDMYKRVVVLTVNGTF